MSTVFDGVGKPIINNNGDWVKYSSFSSSSTVVLDPAAFLDNWKKQIQGKHNIPVHQQRLTFACNHSPVSGVNLFSWSSTSEDQTAHVPVVGDFVTCLQSWQAIFLSKKPKKSNIARLVNPEVLTESDKLPTDLKSKAAEEFRNLGIPCSVYYLSFDKWIVTTLHSQNCQGTTQHCKELSSLCIRVDEDFQQTEFEVNLYGRLSKSSQSLHFSYILNGRHIAAHMSMREQTALYREGQKVRHSLGKRNAHIDKAVDGSSAESLLEVDKTSILLKQGSGQDYYIPGSKDQELIAVIKNRELKFSVAWYPIYRIPEGPLRAAFLTYHSLGHFVHRSTSSNAPDRDVVDCIVTPVVGLESYNAQAECWFIPKHFQFSSEENLYYNPTDVMTERLRTLQETASSMSRGCTKEGNVLACSKHKDYEFFLKHKR